MKYLTVALLIIIFFFIAVVTGHTMVILTERNSENLCYQYESLGYIPTNSCYCSARLFDTWGESYNWIDACEILEARK